MQFAIVDGDVTDAPADAIVNAWNRNVIPWFLLLPAGVARAIGRKAGWRIYNELLRKGPIPAGGAVATRPGRLAPRVKHIIHVAGIDLLWRATPRTIAESTANAVRLARELGCSSVAMPIIGGGVGGRADRALEMMTTVLEKLPDTPPLAVTVYRFATPQPARGN